MIGLKVERPWPGVQQQTVKMVSFCIAADQSRSTTGKMGEIYRTANGRSRRWANADGD